MIGQERLDFLSLDSISTLQANSEEKKEELDDLNSWRTEMTKDKTLDNSVNKFLSEINDYDLYRYIFDYVGDMNSGSPKTTIKNMTISE